MSGIRHFSADAHDAERRLGSTQDASTPLRVQAAVAIAQDVSAVLDLPAGIEYLHVPGACLAALFEGDKDLSGHQDLTYGLQLAVYEICANIVVHGYQLCAPDDAPATDGALRRIRIVFTVAQQPLRLVIDLYDTGCSFDITQVPEPDMAEPQARGYGLYLIRQLVDEVVYEAQEDGVHGNANHWRLTKFL
jgi:serine/threonine-protein kinase RsbW